MYLLGLARILTGQFSPPEIALTIIIGAASAAGIATAAINWRSSPLGKQLPVAAFFFGLQLAAMWLSLQPQFATR